MKKLLLIVAALCAIPAYSMEQSEDEIEYTAASSFVCELCKKEIKGVSLEFHNANSHAICSCGIECNSPASARLHWLRHSQETLRQPKSTHQ